MLKENFFIIEDLDINNYEVSSIFIINAGHAIFKGHFPDQPVVPGVCMLQMTKELLEQVIKKKTDLISASDIKFLAVIDPFKNNAINVSLQYSIDPADIIVVIAKLFKENEVHFKFKGKFRIV